MSRFPLFALTLFALTASGCSRDVLRPVDAPPAGDTRQVAKIPHIDRTELDQMLQQAMMPDGWLAVIGEGRKMVEVPDGSVDALADAIAMAGPNGVVLLKAGTHTETGTVQIPFRVHLVGEEGAELVTSAGGLENVEPTPTVPALHVLANYVQIQNITFRPASGDGNTAILIDGANHTTLFRNRMAGYQFGIIVARGDHSRIWSNTIVTHGGWQTGAIGNAFGITLVNGSYTSVMENDVTNSLFGIWSCGDRGTLAFNRASANFIGVTFCTVPAGALQLPDGSFIGADVSCRNWVAVHNRTTQNLNVGFLVIDNANNNTIADNESSDNGSYDIELTGDTFRFGFLTPASFDNTFIAGAYTDIEVKDCGNNNTIIGGTLVDNNLEPCN